MPMFKRGVNLGSQFIVELWMAEGSWKETGCSKYNDEWACVEAIGPTGAEKAFKGYWAYWTTESDIIQISSLVLNTVRTPIGFYIREDLVYDDDYFPLAALLILTESSVGVKITTFTSLWISTRLLDRNLQMSNSPAI
ncbi:Glucan endo-1,6-beta-glucosidase B [Ilyonectria robusta]